MWSTPPALGSFTLKPGSYGYATEAESDRDETYVSWNVPNPRFEVRANIDQVRGWDWTKGETLSLQIDDPTTPVNPDYATTQTVVVTPWDPNQSYIEFNLSGIYDIQAGDVVSLTNGPITKSTMVTDLEITGIDVGNDTVSGKAAAGTNVDLWACDPNNCSNTYRHVTADGDGTWIADFSIPGLNPDEQNTFNIVPGTWVDSQQLDGDSDSTMYGLNVPLPTHGSAVGEGWITSPAGAYTANPAFTGKATLEFNAKYSKNSPTLKGSVVFTFKGFNFLSTSLDWQAIEGGRMQLTGSGTVNDKGSYGFIIDAAKNPPGAGGKDTFRIRIWDRTTGGQVVYDNMPGAADYVIPVTPVQGGTIKLTP